MQPHQMILTLTAFLVVGCHGAPASEQGDQTTGGDPGSVKPVNGKADTAATLCREAGQPDDCDICAIRAWYDDGKCDDFCKAPDPDCGPEAPRLIAPVSSMRYTGLPIFRWETPQSADTSLIQICLDRQCNAVVRELRGESGASLGTPLDRGVYFCRGYGVRILPDGTESRGTEASPIRV